MSWTAAYIPSWWSTYNSWNFSFPSIMINHSDQCTCKLCMSIAQYCLEEISVIAASCCTPSAGYFGALAIQYNIQDLAGDEDSLFNRPP